MNQGQNPMDEQRNQNDNMSHEPQIPNETVFSNGQYTTSNGTHGYIYSPDQTPKGSGVGRKVLLALGITGGCILLMGGCLFGAFMAGFVGRDIFENGQSSETEYAYEVPGTTNGLVIMDDTAAEQDDKSEIENGKDSQGTNVLVGNTSWSNVSATIQKKQPQRQDADQDGRADVSFDNQGNVITSAGELSMNTATIVAKVAASVVEISTETIVQDNRVGQYMTSGAGSGVIIAKEGYIVTNHHVIEDADHITVRLNNGKEFAAALVGTDEATDIAVLWIDAGDYALTVANLGCSYDLVAGEDILAIGNPLGSLGGTVTEGIISATDRSIRMDSGVMTLLQVSAPINPGNSGGGLFNKAGELVGVVNAKVTSEDIEGLGFAIPVDVAYDIVCELIEYRYVRGRVTSGLTLVDVSNSATAMYYFGTRYTGVYVYESKYDQDLQYGDLVLSVDGKTLTASDDLSDVIADFKVGDQVTCVVYRQGEEVTVQLTLVEYVPSYVTDNE